MGEDVLGEILYIIEIQGVVLHLAIEVGGEVALEHLFRELDPRSHEGRDVFGRILLERNFRKELAYSLFRPLYPKIVHAGLGQLFLVFLVYDGKRLREAEAVDLLPEQFDAEAVDGADEIIVVAAVDHLRNPDTHLASRLVGKGEAEDVRRVNPEHIHEIGIAVSQSPCLSCPRTSYDADPALGGFYSLQLPAIKNFEKRQVRHS